MRRNKAVLGPIAIALGALLTLAGCPDILRSGSEEQGTLSLVLLVPPYAGSTGGVGDTARIIDPQTDTIKVFLDGQMAQGLVFADLDVVGSPVEFFTRRSADLAVPAKTYHSVRLDLLDAAGNTLTRGAVQGDFSVTAGGTLEVSVFCAPLTTLPLDTSVQPRTGYVDPNTMVYYDFLAQIGVTYRATFGGDNVLAFLIAGSGEVLQTNVDPPEMDFTVAAPAGSTTNSTRVYIGIYGVTYSAYTLALQKLGAPAAANVVINELHRNVYGGSPAIEIHNPTAEAVDLSQYRLLVRRKWAMFGPGYDDNTYVLGTVGTLPTGGYLALISGDTDLAQAALNRMDSTWAVTSYQFNVYDTIMDRNYLVYRLGLGWGWVWDHLAEAMSYDGEPDAHGRNGKFVYSNEVRFYNGVEDVVVRSIRSFDSATGAQTGLTATGSYRNPRWSSSGARFAYVSDESGSADVYTALGNAYQSDVVHVTTHGAQELWPSWSPDDTRIAYSSDRNGHGQIYAIDAVGTNDTQITTDTVGEDMWPVWSPDGTRIAFVRANTTDEMDRDIYVVDATTHTLTKVTSATADYRYPEWLDDDTLLCTLSRQSAYWNRRVGMAVEIEVAGGAIKDLYTFSLTGAHELRLQPNSPVGVYDPAKVNYAFPMGEPWDQGGLWLGNDGEPFAVLLLDPGGGVVDYVEVDGSIPPLPDAPWDTSAGVVSMTATVARRILGGTVVDTDSAADWEETYGTLGFANDTNQDQLVSIYAR